MTASVSRPPTTAAAASPCPGRSSSQPNESRATRVMRLSNAVIAGAYPPVFRCKQRSAITPTGVRGPFVGPHLREPFWVQRQEVMQPLLRRRRSQPMADLNKRFTRDDDAGTNAGG